MKFVVIQMHIMQHYLIFKNVLGNQKSKKKKQCSKFDDISKVAIEGAATETVQLYGTAGKEHLVAYSGIDNENDTELAKGLKQIAESNVNPNYKIQNIKQQAGFAAEVKYTARQNAEKTIKSPVSLAGIKFMISSILAAAFP